MVRIAPLVAVAALGLMAAACAEPTPQEIEADRILDAADARADKIEAEAENRAATLEAQAAQMINKSGTAGGYDAEFANIRADALRKEAELVEEQAEAQAQAIRDQGQAQASALLAQ